MTQTPQPRNPEAAIPPSGPLDALYRQYNRRCFVRPDPLQFLYEYPDIRDRELVALVASSLAYGRVAQILKSVSRVLALLGPSPHAFLMGAGRKDLHGALADFAHRFSRGREVADMLWAARRAVRSCGSLEACFAEGLEPEQETVLPALTAFVDRLHSFGGRRSFLLAQPGKGSACKRWHLFLRWMVREDEVDPGGWHRVSPSMLIVPLDTHMHRIGLRLGGTVRRQADLKAALEVTHMFRRIAPDDPVRYDFSLTRLGIREDTDMEGFLCMCQGPPSRTVPRSG
jgi:uncharacterized protein (TIGR02757 family)